MHSFQINKDRHFLMRRVGDISQLAGLKRYRFSEGKATGIEAVDIKTGSGLSFTVLPGRGMDIAWAEFRGIPFGYMSKTGIVSPEYYESSGVDWLRTFFAGLLTTCGLSNAGIPSSEQHKVLGKQEFGLHGRISNMAAEQVSVKEEWEGDELLLSVSGRMRESTLHGENILLKRTVSTSLGAQSFQLHDEISNEGFNEQPLMLLYHINIGYPLISEQSVFVSSSNTVSAGNNYSNDKISGHAGMNAPIANEPEHLFFHELKMEGDGTTYCAIINPALEIGVYIQFNKIQLPQFTQWKMLAEAEYVMGLEPGNCNPIGRENARKSGTLEILKPGETKKIDLEIGILATKDEIDNFYKKVRALK